MALGVIKRSVRAGQQQADDRVWLRSRDAHGSGDIHMGGVTNSDRGGRNARSQALADRLRRVFVTVRKDHRNLFATVPSH